MHLRSVTEPRYGREADLSRELDDLREESRRLHEEIERLRALVGLAQAESPRPPIQAALFPTDEPLPDVDAHSTIESKVALMRTLFHAREDVYAVRWISARSGRAGYSPATTGRWSSDTKARRYLPLTDEVLETHLLGQATVGVYPLLQGDMCWFVAADFDGGTWALDALAFLGACHRHGVAAALERSRSGNGAHVWIFFGMAVTATSARRLGTAMLRETMVSRAEMDLASYDRFFPSQDFLPKGGFGNLIVLPLQGASRAQGNTEFLDPSSLTPWPDQWAFLGKLPRLTREKLESLVDSLGPVSVGPGAMSSALRLSTDDPPAPPQINCSSGAVLSVEKSGLPPSLLSSIKHLASLRNPMFYERERLRLSNHRTPRFIKCYEEDLSHLHLPRGVLHDVRGAVRAAGSALDISDLRRVPDQLTLEFHGTLSRTQHAAVTAMLAHDDGVLVAPPGTGKTVMGCAFVAERNLPTLVLVHRKPLLDQWRHQLTQLLRLSPEDIGQIGGGKNKRTGLIDIAMLQSLKGDSDLERLFGNYGLLVIDECHHIPAFSFESCVKRASVPYLLGLTATPYRRDGLEGIIEMRCGPVRHRISTSPSVADGGLRIDLTVRDTALTFAGGQDASIQDIFRAVVNDASRTELVCDDVLAAVARGRRCLVLSERKEHVRKLSERLRDCGKAPLVVDGGLRKKDRDVIFESIRRAPPDQDLIVIATGQYLGEGFDCPQLDALFLAFPVSFRGKLVQYTGRLLREYEGKTSVTVYDYADRSVPVLKAMLAKRMKTYKSLRFIA